MLCPCRCLVLLALGSSLAAVACGEQDLGTRPPTEADAGQVVQATGQQPAPATPLADAGVTDAVAQDTGGGEATVTPNAPDSSAPLGPTTDDAGASPMAVACGNVTCRAPSAVCCVNLEQEQWPSSYACVGNVAECQGQVATALECASAADCGGGQICCLSGVGSVYGSACVPSSQCTDPDHQAELCDPNGATSGCPSNAGPASTCSSTNIVFDWGLPPVFGTCGGE